MAQRKSGYQTGAGKTHKTSDGKKSDSINPVRCPKNMSLEQWQCALRNQAAKKEYFGIEKPLGPGDPFIVTSAKSSRSYRVFYYGPNKEENRCECMDFKTSRLGTCKHLETVAMSAKSTLSGQSGHTYVFVDYVKGRQVRIHRGRSMSAEMDELISGLFDTRGFLKDEACDPSEFIRRIKALDESFEWEPDALNLLIENRDKIRRKKIIREKYSSSRFDGLLKTSLHPYQADGVRFAFEGGRTINADEMGLGKTVQAIATAELLKREGLISTVLIICPTSLKYQWQSEIRRFTDSSCLVVEGDLTKRMEQLNDRRYFYKICSFHSISNNIKAAYIPEADMVIYDELQRLKNKETQMGKQLRKLSSQYVLALTGTPLENKLDELYSVTQLVDQFVLGPYYKFIAETTITNETGKIIGYRNLHKVAQRLHNTLIRRKKSEVKLQMPARTDTNLFVPMTKEQRSIHDECQYHLAIIVQKWHRFHFLSENDRKKLLLLLSTMRMVCDSTFILDQKTRHDTKIDETMEIVLNLIETEGKVVIFSQWERMLRILSEDLKSRDIDFCFLHGGVPSVKRKDLIDRFRDDPDCRIFLSTDAGATGLNLQSASLLINLDLPWNPAVLEQRIARIYRLGQTSPVQIINMVAKESIEERMLTTLKFKSDLAAGILDGGDDAVFFDNNKFGKIIEVVEGVVVEKPDFESVQKEDSNDGTESTKVAPDNRAPKSDETIPQPLSDSSRPGNSREDRKDRPEPKEKSDSETHHRNDGLQSPETIRQTVVGGLAALGKIADMLATPETTRSLVDALVKEDPETGQTSLSIPVPDKATVVNLLSAFSSFLNRR